MKLRILIAIAMSWTFASCGTPQDEGFGPRRAVIERRYETPDASPIWFGGESKATDAYATEYCLYADIGHADGTFTYKVLAVFTEGTHDWEMSGRVVYPKSPVNWIRISAVFRNGKPSPGIYIAPPLGEVKFRNVFLERRDPGHVPIASRRMTGRPYADRDEMLVSYPARAAHDNSRFAYVPEEGPSRCGATSPVEGDGLCVWTADSMRKVTPLTFPSRKERETPASISVSLAKGERESAQILFTTGPGREVEGVSLSLSPLVNAAGEALDGSITWQRLGYLARRPEYAPHPYGVDPCEKWIPEVLLPAAPMRLRKGGTQGAWLTVFAGRSAKAGIYAGHVDVVAGGKVLGSVPVSVEVWGFALPEKFSLRATVSFIRGFLKRHYTKDFAKRHREAMDMMLDHRLNWTDKTRTSLPDIDDIAYTKSRGQNCMCILALTPPPKDDRDWVIYGKKEIVFTEAFFTYVTNTLTPYVAELRRRNLIEDCCIAGFDERPADYYEGMDRMWRRLKRLYPDLPLHTSAFMYRDRVLHPETVSPYWETTDWHGPLTEYYREDISDYLRSKGKQVWWYTCCGPYYPYCNFSSLEYPAIEARLMAWFTHLYRSDGLSFWSADYWPGQQPKLDEADVFFPEWNTWSPFQAPGDGVLSYPGRHGILPSIRLANLRDGSEDYDYLVMAAAKDPAAVKAIEQSLIRSMTDFTRDTTDIRAARAKLAEIILK